MISSPLLPTHPIVAVATAPGTAGIAVVRLSGDGAITLADHTWKGSRPLSTLKGYSAAYGSLLDAQGEVIDEAVATVFRAPHSFTSQDTVEFSVHGSPWIQRRVVERLIELGAKPAEPGEFTQRAFLSGRIDLAQAEGVADLIASSSRAAHRLAMSQARGTFSSGLETLRQQLIDFAAMLELELDFGEEEVEFADRSQLLQLATNVKATVDRLADSFRAGKAFREGIPVVIAGIPNAGKSTLLNHLLHDDKAIVSAIPGTTRDIVEDTREIGGILFRFADTAGLRDTTDTVEAIGVERARTRLATAAIVIWVIDPTVPLTPQLDLLTTHLTTASSHQQILPFISKTDIANSSLLSAAQTALTTILSTTSTTSPAPRCQPFVSGPTLEQPLVTLATADHNPDTELIVTNARHHAALLSTSAALTRAINALNTGLSADFVAQDVREATHHLATITATDAAITSDTLLHTIFSRFCIGK